MKPFDLYDTFYLHIVNNNYAAEIEEYEALITSKDIDINEIGLQFTRIKNKEKLKPFSVSYDITHLTDLTKPNGGWIVSNYKNNYVHNILDEELFTL